jgi:SAM-dependent methyltransferase
VSRERAGGFAADALARGEPLAWFEQLYASAPDESAIPWADLKPHRLLMEWLDAADSEPGRALVVACGLGDDAEELARRGYDVTGFDVAPSAIAWAKRRFPQSSVSYVVANALELPSEWVAAFDLVVEIYTLQALPEELRAPVGAAIVRCVAPGGTLVAIARARAEGSPPTSGPPWPLTAAELTGYLRMEGEHTLDRRADVGPRAEPGVSRMRLVIRRPL